MHIPKIRGYVAEKRNIVVFLYRKTNKITYLIHLKYDRKKENFTLGSRFFGRFYPNRCDISIDGNHFLYFVMGQSQKKYEKKLYCWTAICTPPILKANLLFEHNDTWQGGGRFLDGKTIFINNSISSTYETSKENNFGKYKITNNGKIEDNGWGSGKNWKLIEKQNGEISGSKYSVPKYWIKTNGKITLKRKFEYNNLSKVNQEKTLGEYDIYSYEVIYKNSKISLTVYENNCLWADFDNYGRLIACYGSKVIIYNNYTEIFNRTPSITHNIEELITLPNNV